jgi:hypothetical protein
MYVAREIINMRRVKGAWRSGIYLAPGLGRWVVQPVLATGGGGGGAATLHQTPQEATAQDHGSAVSRLLGDYWYEG